MYEISDISAVVFPCPASVQFQKFLPKHFLPDNHCFTIAATFTFWIFDTLLPQFLRLCDILEQLYPPKYVKYLVFDLYHVLQQNDLISKFQLTFCDVRTQGISAISSRIRTALSGFYVLAFVCELVFINVSHFVSKYQNQYLRF